MKSLRSVMVLFIIVGLLFTLVSCGYSESDLDEAYEDGYEEGRVEGYEEGYDEGFVDGLYKGLDGSSDSGFTESDFQHILQMALEEARMYANEKSDDTTFWAAMDIVSVYLDGYDPDGYPLPTNKEFEEAVDVLFNYALFLEVCARTSE